MIIYWYYWCCFEAVSPIFPLNSRFIWTRPMGIPARTPRTPAPMGWRSTEAPPAGTSRKMRIRTNRPWGIYDHQPIPLTFCFCHIVSPRQCVFFRNLTEKKNSQICICRKVDWTNHSQLHCESLKTNFDQHKLWENHKPASSRSIGLVLWASDIL